jgi:hypothetical protein
MASPIQRRLGWAAGAEGYQALDERRAIKTLLMP